MKPDAPRNASRTWMLFADLMLLAFAAALAAAGHLGNRLAPAEAERDEARRQRDAASADLAAARRQLAAATTARDQAEARRIALVAELAAAAAARDRAEERRIALADELAAARTREQMLQGKLTRALAEGEKAKDLQAKVDTLSHQIKELEEQKLIQAKAAEEAKADAERAVAKEKGVRQELLGLKSKQKDRLGKVALLVDTSGSMDDKAANGSSRWKLTRDTIRAWVEYLAADEVVLIRFHSRVELPRAFRVGDADARKEFLAEVDRWKPEGSTATYDALAEAYAHSPDAIILFTDGAPTEEIDGRKTGKEAIYKLVAGHRDRNVPINVVGVGQYFDVGFSAFLLELARLSDGSFQGR